MPWRSSLVMILFLAAITRAGDWPQWLGPNRDGSTPDKVAAWKDAPKVLWKQPVGEGHSSPVVAGGKVFLHTKVTGKDEEELTAFDAADGKPAWKVGYPRGNFRALFGNGPRGTPLVDGDYVYTFGITGILTCFQVGDGKQVWQVDTLKKFDAKNGPQGLSANLFFGMSASPLLEGDRLLMNVGGKGAGIVAFDKKNGDVIWKALDDKASYASPILVTVGTQKQAVFLTHEGVVAVDPGQGDLLWRYSMVDTLAESSTTPVKADDLIVAGSITTGSVGLKPEKDTKPAWKNEELNCYFSTPVLIGKHLYMVTGTAPANLNPQADLRCVEAATGKQVWRKEKIGKYHAALLRTGDDKLLMLDDAGNLILLEPSAKECTELARSKVCGPDTWAHPAVADGRLYLRDGANLICLQLPQ